MDLFGISYVTLWIVVLVETAVLVLLLRAVGSIFLGSRDAIERDGIPVGEPAPLINPHGLDVLPGLAATSEGWQFLIFSVPTCQICRRLLPELGGVQRRLQGVVRFVVLLQGTPAVAEEFSTLTGHAIPVVAIDRSVAKAYRVRVSPFVHVVDADGKVRAKGLVNTPENAEHLLMAAGVQHPSLERHIEAHQVA